MMIITEYLVDYTTIYTIISTVSFGEHLACKEFSEQGGSVLFD